MASRRLSMEVPLAGRVVSGRGQTLDSLDFLGLQAESEDFEIFPHIAGLGGAVRRSGPTRDGPSPGGWRSAKRSPGRLAGWRRKTPESDDPNPEPHSIGFE